MYHRDGNSEVSFGTYKKVGARPFMYLMQGMVGYCATYHTLMVPSTKRTALESPEDIDAGCDCEFKHQP